MTADTTSGASLPARAHSTPRRQRALALPLLALLISPAFSGCGGGGGDGGGGGGGAPTQAFTYDALGRLTAVTYSDGRSITYEYDPAGNIKKRTVAAQ